MVVDMVEIITETVVTTTVFSWHNVGNVIIDLLWLVPMVIPIQTHYVTTVIEMDILVPFVLKLVLEIMR